MSRFTSRRLRSRQGHLDRSEASVVTALLVEVCEAFNAFGLGVGTGLGQRH